MPLWTLPKQQLNPFGFLANFLSLANWATGHSCTEHDMSLFLYPTTRCFFCFFTGSAQKILGDGKIFTKNIENIFVAYLCFHFFWQGFCHLQHLELTFWAEPVKKNTLYQPRTNQVMSPHGWECLLVLSMYTHFLACTFQEEKGKIKEDNISE